MKFIKSQMPLSEGFDITKGEWMKSKEPNQNKFLIYTIPITVILLIVMGIIGKVLFNYRADSFYIMLSIIILVPIHEFIHALVFPEPIKSENVIFGMWIKKGIFYAYYEGEMSKNRFIITLIMPFIVLSVLPIIFMAILGLNSFVFEFCRINAICSCGDILGVFIVIFNIPNASIVRNKGWETYYRL